MQCFKPIFVRGPDEPPVPCGKCFACQSNRRRDFHFRIKYEMLHSLYSLTITLTYDNEHIPDKVFHHFESDPLKWVDHPDGFWYHPINFDHVQRFFKRLRKSGYKFRYFGVGEYGSKSARPHYHIIFFFNQSYDWRKFKIDVLKNWYYGSQITIDETNDDCIGYTLKYCLKPFTSTDPSAKIFCSKKPFIGSGYLSESTEFYLYNSHSTDIVVPSLNGFQRLPRIIRDRVFSPVFDETVRDIQKATLQDYVQRQVVKDTKIASERGLTYEEYFKLKRDAFVTRVWNQIKKKSL